MHQAVFKLMYIHEDYLNVQIQDLFSLFFFLGVLSSCVLLLLFLQYYTPCPLLSVVELSLSLRL